MQTDRVDGMTIEASASLLGVSEFTLLSRIQSGELEMARAGWGEVLIPKSELERLASVSIELPVRPEINPLIPDGELGIERTVGRLKRNGENLSFRVPCSRSAFNEGEVNSYRAALSAIAGELTSVADLKNQLGRSEQVPTSARGEVHVASSGVWRIRSALLSLDPGEILFCQRGDEFALIERFPENSRFARVHGRMKILLHGSEPAELVDEFQRNAQSTLEFLASNLTAKAQRIVWEQFPDERPERVMAAISERCRQAVTNQEQETAFQCLSVEAPSRGVRV